MRSRGDREGRDSRRSRGDFIQPTIDKYPDLSPQTTAFILQVEGRGKESGWRGKKEGVQAKTGGSNKVRRRGGES